MPTYSFGEDSPIKFEIPDKMAVHYNEATKEWFKAQQRFKQKFGRRWDPFTDPIALRWTRQQKKAWNDFATVFNKVIERDGPFHETAIMDDYLVRNGAALMAKTSTAFGRFIGAVVFISMAYSLVRELQK